MDTCGDGSSKGNHRTYFKYSIKGLPVGIWKAATAGAGSFANGPAAYYRRIAVLRVLKSCGPKLPAFPFLGFAYACINDSPSDIQVSQVQYQRLQSAESNVHVCLLASQPVEIDQQRMTVHKSALRGLLVGFRLGVLFMQPRGSGNPMTVHE
ncbi:uncharacterized protein [Acropora muricata]|uniref:uncharacterized protein isoform X2 n=1 Tax=Acropora muricata TaxID=159855 RepID=UPI0034E55472